MGVAMESNLAIFGSAGQAVHVSYLIMAQEAQQDAPLRKALIRIMESVNLPDGDQRDWLDQLRGSPSGTINFGGLGMEDVRAQCSLVTLAVTTKLPKPEMWALQAKFGMTDFEENEEDGQLPKRETPRRRYAFSAERINAIKGLSDWLAPSFPSLSPWALDCMLGKMYANHVKMTISFRDLAANFGSSHQTYARAFKRMRQQLAELEQQAFARLEIYLRGQGVVGEISESY